jgi:CubicO group peptidase (beta-lactamase class C family)
MGLDAHLLAQARDYALSGGGSGMITRGGRLVFSWGSTSAQYDVKSTTKSIASILVGLALQDGLIALNEPAYTYLSTIGTLPESNSITGWLGEITLLHLGAHTAGFDKPGGYTPLLFKPGTAWLYSDGGTNWLADVLTNVYHADLNTIAFSRAFALMGLTENDLRWRSNSYREDTLNGVKRREFGSGISLNVDAMARIGYLFLRRGMWDGVRVVPDAFVQQVQQPQPQVVGLPVLDGRGSASNHYGYLWWTNADGSLPNVPRDAFWSWGLHESLIIVIPSLDIVVARAGGAWRTGLAAGYAVLEPFFNSIVEAVRDSISVPSVIAQSQPAAIAALQAAGLAVAGVTQQESVAAPLGYVVSQSPVAGAQVARYTGVELVVAAGSGSQAGAAPQITPGPRTGPSPRRRGPSLDANEQ